ncbi:uncharacterized protein Dwil_GK12835 [Drosophila willistoni]|uniref:Uncharacterized protein n=1 Tax=Drosophila willistoni TaxID=7260 RepID=B4NJP1_DROWI|nr:zinc finger protein 184 [Drosophila willistoni]EDW85003.1 uncharacterized protein Dwil_GK12835 [Drosophila willistoni]
MPEAEDKIYPDINILCRLCLKELENLDEAYKIFAENDLSMPMKFIQCISIEAKPSDVLPKIICIDCRYQLEKSFLFRQRSLVSDKKLRKHFRLLALGKRSRIFAKSQEQEHEDYDDEELDFEDSVSFIKEQDEKRENAAEKWREKFKEEQKTEMENLLAAAKLELKKKVRVQLAEEVRSEVREQVRQDIQEEMRNEQMGKLLGELEIFLSKKKAGIWETMSLPNKNDKLEPAPKRVMDEHQLLDNSAIEMDDEELPTISPTHEFRDVKMVSAGELVSTQDGQIYIINSDTVTEETKPVEETEPEDGITSYNINDDGEIQFCGEKSSEMDDVIGFDLDDDMEDEAEDEPQQQVFQFEEDVVIVPKDEKTNIKRPLKGQTRSNDMVCKESPHNIQTPLTGRVTDTVKTFQCDLCPAAFATQKLLSRHCNAHAKTLKKGKSGTLKCPTCHLQLSCTSSLKRHMIIHTGLKPFKCDECDLSFSQREVLKRHKDTHTGVRRHKCPSCNSCFAQKSNMQQHIARVHMENSRTHQCHLCERSFSHLSGLSRHLVTHSGVVFSCKECGRQFNDRSAVSRHVQTVHKILKKSVDDNSELEETDP